VKRRPSCSITWPARTAGLEVQAEPTIVETLLKLLEQVAGKRRRKAVEASGPYTAAVLASRPIAYWRLGEFAGPQAHDAAQHSGPALYEDGVVFYLDGPEGSGFCGPQETSRAAHELGLRTNCTMLYGHIENDEDRADHLVRLRELQDQTHGFDTFIPLAFHPDNTALRHIPKTTGFADIKNIAVARLMLDNIPHIKAYWVMLTPRIAQIALRFGADDLDGTIVEERIYHDAGATTSQGLRRAELLQLIRMAGREPVERDTLYHPVERKESTFTVLT